MASNPFNSFPSVDFSTMPKFDLPKFDLPNFDFPNFDSEAIITSATDTAKDAAYITVGLGVMAFQKAQVRRRELSKSLTDQFASGKAQIDELVDAVEARLATLDNQFVALEDKLDIAVENLEKRLPEQAGALLNTAHETARSARKQVRSRVLTTA
ncbi:MAG: hypothetical protein ABIR32_10785 [Ilumatobacteraceae bacterium]